MEDKDDRKPFLTLIHGEPWTGSAFYRYTTGSEGESSPAEAIFADFHACSLGRPGTDLAHFLLTSTTREFRKHHLDTILQSYLTELVDIVASQGEQSKWTFLCTIFECPMHGWIYKSGFVNPDLNPFLRKSRVFKSFCITGFGFGFKSSRDCVVFKSNPDL